MNDVRNAKIGDWICFDEWVNSKKKSIFFNLKEVSGHPANDFLRWHGKAVIVSSNEISKPEYKENYSMIIERFKYYDNATIVSKKNVYDVITSNYNAIAGEFVFKSIIDELTESKDKWVEFDWYEELWNNQAIGKIKDVFKSGDRIEIKFYSVILISPTSITSRKDVSYSLLKSALGDFKYKFVDELYVKKLVNKEILNVFLEFSE